MKNTIQLFNPSQRPRPSSDAPEFSETVMIIDEHGLDGIGYFCFKDDEWAFHTDTLVDYNEKGHETRWKWYYSPVKWEDAEPVVDMGRRSAQIDLLEKYSLFLQKQGHLDTDWNSEPPYAIDEFLKTLTP